jgi:hypothetical protein
MDSEPIRLTIYLGLAMLLSTCMSTIWVARNKPLSWSHIPYARLAITALGLFTVWLILLAFSIRDFNWLKRSDLIWPMASLSGGATVLGWAWWALAVKRTFRIEHRAAHRLNGNGVV